MGSNQDHGGYRLDGNQRILLRVMDRDSDFVYHSSYGYIEFPFYGLEYDKDYGSDCMDGDIHLLQ